MLKYEYENATVYITKPTEEHMKNIRKATKIFLEKVVKEQIENGSRKNNRRVGINDSNAGRRNKKVK